MGILGMGRFIGLVMLGWMDVSMEGCARVVRVSPAGALAAPGHGAPSAPGARPSRGLAAPHAGQAVAWRHPLRAGGVVGDQAGACVRGPGGSVRGPRGARSRSEILKRTRGSGKYLQIGNNAEGPNRPGVEHPPSEEVLPIVEQTRKLEILENYPYGAAEPAADPEKPKPDVKWRLTDGSTLPTALEPPTGSDGKATDDVLPALSGLIRNPSAGVVVEVGMAGAGGRRRGRYSCNFHPAMLKEVNRRRNLPYS
nr:hypothetical protein Iba_chr13dCG4090 [Ipomoea batatas]